MSEALHTETNSDYHRTTMQKESIIQQLRERGCRITKQRLMLLDIILEEEHACCKEIYYKAVQFDAQIGTSTVYRMINLLEDIGAIQRSNLYKIACGADCPMEDASTIELSDGSVCNLNGAEWHRVISEGLRACGYITEQSVEKVSVKSCECGR